MLLNGIRKEHWKYFNRSKKKDNQSSITNKTLIKKIHF